MSTTTQHFKPRMANKQPKPIMENEDSNNKMLQNVNDKCNLNKMTNNKRHGIVKFGDLLVGHNKNVTMARKKVMWFEVREIMFYEKHNKKVKRLRLSVLTNLTIMEDNATPLRDRQI
jgi:hypothetical protein